MRTPDTRASHVLSSWRGDCVPCEELVDSDELVRDCCSVEMATSGKTTDARRRLGYRNRAYSVSTTYSVTFRQIETFVRTSPWYKTWSSAGNFFSTQLKDEAALDVAESGMESFEALGWRDSISFAGIHILLTLESRLRMIAVRRPSCGTHSTARCSCGPWFEVVDRRRRYCALGQLPMRVCGCRESS